MSKKSRRRRKIKIWGTYPTRLKLRIKILSIKKYKKIVKNRKMHPNP
jgi:hypothetical protein